MGGLFGVIAIQAATCLAGSPTIDARITSSAGHIGLLAD
jgi:hypothetical protein